MEIRALALVMGLKMLSLGARNRDEIEQAFATVVRERPDALLVLADLLFLHDPRGVDDNQPRGGS